MNLSIRFKLTLWYSIIFIVTAIVYVLVTNVIVTRQIQKSPQQLSEQIETTKRDLLESEIGTQTSPDFVTFREVLEEIHQRDLDRIRVASWVVFVSLVVLSFFGGYVIAGRTLRPLYNSLELQKQFIANASHELKTPLAISQTNIEAALQDASVSRAELESYLKQAVQSTSFMNRLIDDLLLLTVTDQQIPFEPVDLRTVVEQAVSQLQTVAQQSDKTLTLVAVPPTALYKQGNATLLQRAVMNCIENAIKYAQQTITVTIAKKDKQVQIIVQDDGEGIPAEHLPRVTERFFRVDASRSRASGGSGLGLAITKSILDHHHGQLQIASVEGAHTIVTITL